MSKLHSQVEIEKFDARPLTNVTPEILHERQLAFETHFNEQADRIQRVIQQIKRLPDTTGTTVINNATSGGGGGGGGSSSHNLLSATHPDTVPASPNLGDLIGGNADPKWQRLGGNTTSTKQFLTQTGTGVVSAPPVWGTIVDADIPATLVRTSRQITINGTTNRITSSAGAQDLSADRTWTIDISASYVGQSSITTLGIISTGVWQGTPVGVQFGGSGANLSGTGGTGQYVKQSSVGGAFTVGTIPASDIASGAALTKTDDTNITLTLGGTPSTALLVAASITVGWTGTLAAGRLNSNVVQSVVNDTNVTGAIATQTLTLGWTGQLSIARGGTGQSTANAALNALLPSQGGNNGKFLQTDGTNTSWATAGGSISYGSPSNPSVNLTGASGVATSVLRSDAILILDQNISPTWTGSHTFTQTLTMGGDGFQLPYSSQGKGILYNLTDDIGFVTTVADGSDGQIFVISGGSPTWLGGAALTKTDDTNITLTLGGTPSTALLVAASITVGWTGTLAVSRGGIGVGTLASNGVLYGNGTSAVLALAVNSTATNKFLTQVSSGIPAWNTIQASDLPGSFAGFANPTASVGLSVVNGSAATAMRSDGAPALSQAIVPTWTGLHVFATAVRTSGVAHYLSIVTPADTTLTASTESIGIQFGGTNAATPATVTRQWATGALTTQREYVFTAPTYAFVGASTLSNAGTVVITGAPIAGTNATIDNPYALWVQSGLSYFQGGITLTGSLDSQSGADFQGAVTFEEAVDFYGATTFHTDTGYAQFTGCTDSLLYQNHALTAGQVTAIASVADGSVLSSKGTTSTPAYRTLLGTTNQVTVTTNSGNFTFSTPQDIATTSTPQFAKIGIGTAAAANVLFWMNNISTPSYSSFRLTSNTFGSLSFLNYSADNVSIGFDVDWAASVWTARSASVAWLYKQSGQFVLFGSDGNSVNGTATETGLFTVQLSNGNTGMSQMTPLSRMEVNGVMQARRVSPGILQTIDASYGSVVPSDYEMASGDVLELSSGGVMEIT